LGSNDCAGLGVSDGIIDGNVLGADGSVLGVLLGIVDSVDDGFVLVTGSLLDG